MDTSTSLSAGCIFCKIIAGDIPTEKIYEDAETFAFLDINPVHPGHTLILPKTHSRNVLDIAEGSWVATMKTLRRISQAVQRATGADGLNIIMNNEPAGNQLVFHTHIHVIPRFKNDGLPSWHGKPYEDGAIQTTGEKIRTALSED